jgi:hypothetical protein
MKRSKINELRMFKSPRRREDQMLANVDGSLFSKCSGLFVNDEDSRIDGSERTRILLVITPTKEL